MNFKEKIINEYPLNNKLNCELDCYSLEKRRYLIFYDDIIQKKDISQVLKKIQSKTCNSSFTEWKTLIVVGKTNDEFKKEELFYFNNVNTFVVFLLIDESKNKIYKNNSWIFALGCNYKKYVNKINEILSKE